MNNQFSENIISMFNLDEEDCKDLVKRYGKYGQVIYILIIVRPGPHFPQN